MKMFNNFVTKNSKYKMCKGLRTLYLLLHKNFIVRKRHWISSIIELIFPACIMALLLAVRSVIDDGEPIRLRVNETTYFPIKNQTDVIDSLPATNTLHFYYKPQNKFTDNIMKTVSQCTKVPHDQIFGFKTEDDMLHSYEIQQMKDQLISVIAIDFDETGAESAITPEKLIYTIKAPRLIPENLFDNDGQSCSTKADELIIWRPIVALQICVENAFIDETALDGAEKPTVVIQMMPCPLHENVNPVELSIQGVIAVIGGGIFFVTMYLIPTYITAEKTTGVNTLLKMNGVKSYENFLSWLVGGILFSIMPVLILTMLLKLNIYSQKPFYYNSNYVIVWISLLINITHIYAFCLHIASYFSRAWLVQIVATVVPLLVNAGATQLEQTDRFLFVPYIGIIFPTVAGMRIFDELNEHRTRPNGAEWSNLFETGNHALNITGSLGFIMCSSILGIIGHFILAVYLDAVLPSKYGVPKSPLFFLENFKHKEVGSDYEAIDEQSSHGQPKILEPVGDGTLIPGIQLRNLAKTFPAGYFKSQAVDAVRGITLDFYKGQITALLGHNGAGKTTTFSILTGLTAPSAGTVYINGKNIKKDLDTIRNDLGVCPQENLMFPELTVLEQLQIIGLLKRKDKSQRQVTQEVDNMLNKLNMSEKRGVMPDKLSGGHKRRLCLGMALIGDASTIFLDEPTSGMDPETSRGTWDIILKYRTQKTIIITTHSMEEADVLGDRIAIMHSGKMMCYGTSMFLKKFYGHNYHEVTLSTTSSCDEGKVQDIVGPGSKMTKTHHGRIVISIPFTNTLPEILDNMEKWKVELGITGISVSMITLEQVFLKAAEEEHSERVDDVDGTGQPVTEGYKYLTGSELTWQKINALLTKKMTYFKTDHNLFLAMIFGATLAILLRVNFGSNSEEKSRMLHLGVYASPEVLFYSENQTLGNTYRMNIESQGGIATPTQANVSLTHELLSRASIDLTYYKTRMIIAAEFNSSLLANGLYSGGATLSAPITVNAMSNLVLKTVAGNQYSIVASIGNLPPPLKTPGANTVLNRNEIITGIILFIAIFFYIVALFVKHPLLESSTKVKELQLMAGASPFLYWGTMFFVDYACYILVTILIVPGIFLTDFFDKSNSDGLKDIGVLLLLFLIFGINALLLAYIHSFMRKRFYTVYSILCGIPLFLVLLVILLTEVMPYLIDNKNIIIILRRIFSLEPHVSFVFGYVKFAEIALNNARCQGLSNRLDEAVCAVSDLCCWMQCSDGRCKNPLPYLGNFNSEGGLEEFVLYLFVTPIILVGILWLLERQAFAKLLLKLPVNKPKPAVRVQVVDSEVEKEKSNVRQAINQRMSDITCDDGNVFLAYELSKSYGKLNAVEEVNFRVKKNECFGLLGVNGAGKSTTFRMLVGEEVPTRGILHRGPYNMKTNRTEYLSGMGYCPQNDALIPYFNAMEHLSLFASLRGIPAIEVAAEVHSWIDKLKLKKHAKNPSGKYSGGNKRRLNIAMALIASPKLVLLDEPTTGVDPAARRSVWTVLQSCQTFGQAIILTSHSMEECEALCNRLVIMVKGRLLCVGASQELKERFGAGFNITIKLNPARSDEDSKNIKNRIQTAFVCELKDEHSGYLFYHITDANATWVKMFGTMNELKSEYECIEDFTVSTSTLEQLFMQFARSSPDSATDLQVLDQTTAHANGA